MSDYTITIPEALYEMAQQIADESAVSVDEVIRSRLELSLKPSRLDLPKDEQDELKAMSFMSDNALWTLAREQMPQKAQDIMQNLMRKNSLGTIAEDEYQHLTELVEEGQRLTLRKAEAMRLLMQRGFEINLEDLAPENEPNPHC